MAFPWLFTEFYRVLRTCGDRLRLSLRNFSAVVCCCLFVFFLTEFSPIDRRPRSNWPIFPKFAFRPFFFTESRQLFTHELHRNEKTNQQNQKKNNVFSTDFPVPTSADRRSPFRRFAIFLIQFYRVFLKIFFTEFDLGVTEFPPRSSFALRVSPQFSADNTFFFFFKFCFSRWFRAVATNRAGRISPTFSLSLSLFLSFFLSPMGGLENSKKKRKNRKKNLFDLARLFLVRRQRTRPIWRRVSSSLRSHFFFSAKQQNRSPFFLCLK